MKLSRIPATLVVVGASSIILAGCSSTSARDTGSVSASTDASKACKQMGASVEEHWITKTTLPLIDPNTSRTDAVCIRDEFVKRLQTRLGRPLGYKAAAITPPAQRDLGLTEPLDGMYLAGMFRYADSPVTIVPITYGARPIVEAKLMATVKDDGINGAKTAEEIAKHIAYVIPSIELGDSLVDANQKMSASVLTIYNVGARGVIHGTPVRFDGSASSIEALRSFVVTTRDEQGKQVDKQAGSVIMGSPLNAALWIVKDANERGIRLQAGDRLGLGAMSRVRPKVGTVVETAWEGLPGGASTLTVKFQ